MFHWQVNKEETPINRNWFHEEMPKIPNFGKFCYFVSYFKNTQMKFNLCMALQPFVGPWPLFQFIDLFTQSVGLLGWKISPPQGRYLHTKEYKHRINAHTDIQSSGEIRTHDPTVWTGETVHSLDRVVTLIGRWNSTWTVVSDINRRTWTESGWEQGASPNNSLNQLIQTYETCARHLPRPLLWACSQINPFTISPSVQVVITNFVQQVSFLIVLSLIPVITHFPYYVITKNSSSFSPNTGSQRHFSSPPLMITLWPRKDFRHL
jgi:hypothetical protein